MKKKSMTENPSVVVSCQVKNEMATAVRYAAVSRMGVNSLCMKSIAHELTSQCKGLACANIYMKCVYIGVCGDTAHSGAIGSAQNIAAARSRVSVNLRMVSWILRLRRRRSIVGLFYFGLRWRRSPRGR